MQPNDPTLNPSVADPTAQPPAADHPTAQLQSQLDDADAQLAAADARIAELQAEIDAKNPAPAQTETPAAPSGGTSAPASSKPAAGVGDVISYQTDPEDENAITRGLVVGTVEGAEHRDEGLLVVPLSDAFYVPLDAVKD